MPPLDLYLDDDFLGAIATALPPGDTMQVFSDPGPAANQNNIPAGGAYINDIAITKAAPAGQAFFFGTVMFRGNGQDSTLTLRLDKNAAQLLGTSNIQERTNAADHVTQLIIVGADANAVPGDVYKLFVASNDALGDIYINEARLVMLTA